MPSREEMLAGPRPASLAEIEWPVSPDGPYPSPVDWRDQVLYFLLPDRFSDGLESSRPLLDRSNLPAARPALPDGTPWRWDRWAESGAFRWQGGTLNGIRSKIGYLNGLGVTALWIGPVFKQRGTMDTYHGYGIQDLLEVDPRFGTRRDLVDLVTEAHAAGIRVILDVIFNHSGRNWDYAIDGHIVERPGYRSWAEYYSEIAWLGPGEGPISGQPDAVEEGVWPRELQFSDCYTRAGTGNLGDGDINDAHAQHKRTDFENLRDFNFDSPGGGRPDPRTLDRLADCFKYWIALTDCDGFRIDTLKHVSFEQARNFCGAIKEFAEGLGKENFFLVGEVAGGDYGQDRYLDVLGRNLNAALDIGETRLTINSVAKGLREPSDYFRAFRASDPGMGSHRQEGKRHVSVLDDHDHVMGDKIRFSAEAASDRQVVAGVALQLFALGIPCIYYGTEQSLAGPEPAARQYLPGWKQRENWPDRYLRETLFGPSHPRQRPDAGLAAQLTQQDNTLPGFGPFGTAGQHVFDTTSPAYVRIAALADLRKRYPALRRGRQYHRQISNFDMPFSFPGPGELIAWSRLLDRMEIVCVVNGHGLERRGGNVLVDADLNSAAGALLTVVGNTAQAAAGAAYSGTHAIGSVLPVRRRDDGTAYVEVRNVGPSEVVILSNQTLT